MKVYAAGSALYGHITIAVTLEKEELWTVKVGFWIARVASLSWGQAPLSKMHPMLKCTLFYGQKSNQFMQPAVGLGKR